MAYNIASATYNGVTINDVLIQNIDQEAVYDPSSSDWIKTKTEVRFTGIVPLAHPWNASVVGAGGKYIGAGGEVGPYLSGLEAFRQRNFENANDLAEYLSEPRREFQLMFGASTIYNIMPDLSTYTVAANKDVENGPRTKVRLGNFVYGVGYKVEMSVTFHTVICDAGQGLTPGDMLNHRFWVADDIDGKNWLITRTWKGRIIARGRDTSIHLLRAVAYLPVLPGFRREAINFTSSEDGRTLDYQIMDKEYWALPPYPLSEWGGNLQVASPNIGGVIAEAQCDVFAVAPPTVPKEIVLLVAHNILDRKLNLVENLSRNRGQTNDRDNPKAILMNAAYSTRHNANEIAINARIRLAGPDAFYGIVGLAGYQQGTFTGNMAGEQLLTSPYVDPNGQPNFPAYDPRQATYRGPRPGELLGHQWLCLIQDPCSTARVSYAAGVPYSPGSVQTPTDNTTKGQGQDITPTGSNNDDYSTFYEAYKITNDYDVLEGLAAATANYTTRTTKTYPIRLHDPATLRRVVIEAVRINKWPAIPKRESFTDPNGIIHHLRRYRLTPHTPEVSADGLNTIFGCGAVLEYFLSRPPTDGEGYITGSPPSKIYKLGGTAAERSEIDNIPVTDINDGSATTPLWIGDASQTR